LPTFHPDLTLARFLPRAFVGPRMLKAARLGTRVQRTARGVQVVEVAPGVDARIHRPTVESGARVPGVVYLHGGGYVIGNATMGDAFCAGAAEHLGAMVVAVGYRLAPEHPYPTPLDDAYAGLQWLADHPEVERDRIALVGESAGAGLAAGLALLARERGEIRPVLQVLSYPMLDDRTTDGGLGPGVARLWNQRSNRYGWDAYLGELAGGDVPATAAPARAGDFAGLPATWIGVGTKDLFHSETLAWAKRLKAAGVPCEVLEVPDAYHGFDIIESRADVSRAFLRARIAALREGLAGE
jgi:acetyl esterase/lipase